MTQQGYVSNFERATQGLEGGYRGPRYMDSDLYKSLEAAAYVLGRPEARPSPLAWTPSSSSSAAPRRRTAISTPGSG